MAEGANITVDITDGGSIITNVIQGATITGEVATGGKGDTGAQGPQGDPGIIGAIVPGNNIDVDATDPVNPIVSVETLTLADVSDITASATEVNYTDGVTSAIQTQLDAKVPTTRTVNSKALSSNITLNQDDVGDGTTNKQYSVTDKTKLAGIEASADVTDAANVTAAGAFMKSVDDTDDITVGTTNKFATAAEKTKLSNITVTQAVDLDTMESDIAAKQPLDSDLTSIAGLSPTNDDVIQRKSGAWTNRTMSQVKTDLSLTKTDVGLANVDNTSDANKPVSTAQQTALDAKVTGPASATDGALAAYDGTTGKLVRDNPKLVTDADGSLYLKSDIYQSILLGNEAGTKEVELLVDNTDAWGQGTDEFVFAPGGGVPISGYTFLDAADAPLVRMDAATSDVDITGDVTANNLSGTNTGDQDLSGLVPNTRTVNGHALNADVTVSKADVGLGNVTNNAQLRAVDLDTDGTLAANSNTKIPAQKAVKTYADTKQPLDSDLTTIAGLTATTDNFLQAKASAWASRTPTQVKTDLGISNVDNTSDLNKPISTAQQYALDGKSVGSDITIFGHSYLSGGGVSYVDKQYITLLGGMLRSKLFDLALGGSQVANDESWLGSTQSRGGFGWLLQNVNPSSAAAPYTPSNTLPYIHWGHNDMAQHSHDANGLSRTVFKTAIRTALSRLTASRIFENTDSSVAYGGLTWQAANPCLWRNSGTSYQPVPGDTATITITLPSDYDGSPVALGFTVYPTSDGTITFSGTAGVTGTLNLAGLAYSNGGTLFQRDSSNCHTHRITNLTSANAGQTIIMTISGVSATAFSTPSALGALTVNGTSGSTTYGYRHAYRTYNGDTIWSTAVTTTSGNATLSGVNSITLPSGGAWPAGTEKELIFRTTGGTTQGLIGIIDAPGTFTDVGYPATSYTTNTANPLLNGFGFDFWQIEASNPTTKGVVIGLNRIPTAGYVHSASDTDVANYNTDLQSVIAEFSTDQWLYVDADAALAKNSAYFAADNVHPNNLGHSLLAQAVYDAILSWADTWTVENIATQSRSAKSVASRNWAKLVWTIAGQNTGTDMSLTNTLTEVDAVLKRTRLSINAEVGDEIEVYVGGMASNAATTANLEIVTIDASGNVLNYFSTGTSTPQTFTQGVPQIMAAANNVLTPISGSAIYKVKPEDIITLATVPGQVYIKLMARAATARTLYGGGLYTSPPLEIHLKNLSQRNFGFNGS